MEESVLDDLLECSVCLERLDTSSKVLPCQHTFCKKCLEEIFKTQNELRCPECRTLVEIKIDDLPPNVLLVRILEGIRNAPDHSGSGNKKRNHLTKKRDSKKPSNDMLQKLQPQPHQSQSQPQTLPHPSLNQAPYQPLHYHLPCARAIYDYTSKESGDLSFEKGDFIILKQKIDNNWCQGEANGKIGVFPISYVQVICSLPPQIPQCKALYDFKMANDEEEGCLVFNKGDIIKVYRRVDENWAEGALGSRIGIFPLAFVELNALAQIVVKSPKEKGVQLSQYRKVPAQPAEGSNFATPVSTQQMSNATEPLYSTISPFQGDVPGLPIGSESSSVGLTSPPISSSSLNSIPTTSTSSSSTLTSPASPPNVSTINIGPNKRHSFGSTLQNELHNKSKRHSAEILNPPDSSGQPQSLPPETTARSNNFMLDLERQGSQRRRRSVDIVPSPPPPPPLPPPPPIPGPQTHHYPIHLPAKYVARYFYKPQKSDELELIRGASYVVTERCQDGWFKGTNTRSQKSGVFPGNYVYPFEVSYVVRHRMPGHHRPSKSAPAQATSSNNASPSAERLTGYKHAQGSNHKFLEGSEPSRSPSQVGEEQSSTVMPPPNVSVQAVLNKSTEKVKEKKEKGVGLMRRLASMKKSKSPPPTPYSMDNPVFEDSSMTFSQPVHIRSGSCPNQLLATNNTVNDALNLNSPRMFSPSSNRSKHKERPYLPQISPRALTNDSPPSIPVQHRKSNSVDTNSILDVSPQVPIQYFRPLPTNDVPSTSTSSLSCAAPNALQNKLPLGAPDLKPRKVLSSVETQTPGPGSNENLLPDSHSQDDKKKSDVQLIKIEDMKSSENKQPKVYELLSQVMSHSFPVPSPRKALEKTTSSQTKSQPSDSTGKNYARQCAIAKKILSNSWNSHERMPSPPKTLPKERVRCIVPYPPNSEFELELELGDVIYVHKKREDGWYKGTQERTGRTGLFPASFVQSF